MNSTMTYILIDYENVQPTQLRHPGDEPIQVKLFLGANQTKISVTLASAMHSLGENAEYVQVESNGSNALDFHIAYYIGRLAALEPSARFQIISNDTGFDPLIKHLTTKGICIERTASLSTEVTAPDIHDSDIEFVIDFLTAQKSGKPRNKKSLTNPIRSLFLKGRTEKQISAIFQALCSREVIRLEGTKVVYDLVPQDGPWEGRQSHEHEVVADVSEVPF